jgi:glycosyltransferase involved in cell wall biosynthesis
VVEPARGEGARDGRTTVSEVIEHSDPALLVRAPRVSVYMLSFRHAPYLAQAIESVLAQQCDFDIELIIGEDCSPDGSLEIAVAWQRAHPRTIRVLTSGHNVGLTANVARCEAAARGEYVAICEGDDYWTDPGKLARQVAMLDRHGDLSLVFHAAALVDAGSGATIALARPAHRTRRFTAEELVLGDGAMVPTASILVRRSALASRADWATTSPVGDYPLVLSAALHGGVGYLDRCMAAYRINVPTSWTRTQAPSFDKRWQHALRMEAMLAGFAAQASAPAARAARVVASKYLSDVIVRVDGPRGERMRAYADARARLHGFDGMLAWLAARCGVRWPFAKDLVRKARTTLRLFKGWRRGLDLPDPDR